MSEAQQNDGKINLQQLWNEQTETDLVSALRSNKEIQKLLSEAGLTNIDSHITTENEAENIPAQRVIDAQFTNDTKCRIKLVLMPPAEEEPVFLRSVISEVKESLIKNLKVIQRKNTQLDPNNANTAVMETEVQPVPIDINEVPTNIRGPNALKMNLHYNESPLWIHNKTGVPNFAGNTPIAKQAYMAMMCATLEKKGIDTSHAFVYWARLLNPIAMQRNFPDHWPNNWHTTIAPKQAELDQFTVYHKILGYKDYCPEETEDWHLSVLGVEAGQEQFADSMRHSRNQVGSVLLILKNQNHIPIESIRFANLESGAPIRYPADGMQSLKEVNVKQTERRIVDESWNDENADVIGQISRAVSAYGEITLRITEDFSNPGFMKIYIDVSETYEFDPDDFIDESAIVNSSNETIAANIGDSLERALIDNGLLDEERLYLCPIKMLSSQPDFEKYKINGIGNKVTIKILQMGSETVDPSSFKPEDIQTLIEQIEYSYSNGDDIALYITFQQCEVTAAIKYVYVSMYKQG